MLASCAIAAGRGILSPPEHAAIGSLVAQLGPLPPVNDLSAAAQLEYMRRDKKVHEGRLHFVLPGAIGRAVVTTDVSEKELAKALTGLGLAR
jgi:3-dehydroquinate synthase